MKKSVVAFLAVFAIQAQAGDLHLLNKANSSADPCTARISGDEVGHTLDLGNELRKLQAHGKPTAAQVDALVARSDLSRPMLLRLSVAAAGKSFDASSFARDCSVANKLGIDRLRHAAATALLDANWDIRNSLQESEFLAGLAQNGAKAGVATNEVISQPTTASSTEVKYSLANKRLNPGEAVYFEVPKNLADNGVGFVVLGHRQDPSENTGMGLGSTYDENPGVSSVQVLTKINGEYQWRYWNGEASGQYGGKFAEVGTSPEVEGLYEWQKNGHGKVGEDGDIRHDALHPLAMRIVNVGKDPVRLSQLDLKTLPARAPRYLEQTFSPGTKLGDPESAEGRVYGGGQEFGGKFPGAVVLGGYGSQSSPKLPAGWKLEGSELHIPLKAGESLRSLEVACGDSHPDGVSNEDGGIGTKGWGKLSAYVKTANGEQDQFISYDNVPPEGVIMGSPSNISRAAKAGDELVIRGSSDRVYVMGVRLGLSR